jgi:hypothetical protein
VLEYWKIFANCRLWILRKQSVVHSSGTRSISNGFLFQSCALQTLIFVFEVSTRIFLSTVRFCQPPGVQWDDFCTFSVPNANHTFCLHKTILGTVYLFISSFAAPRGEISGSCSLRVVFRSVAMKWSRLAITRKYPVIVVC